MSIRSNLLGLSAIIGLSTATLSGPLQAKGISTDRPLICATVGVVACLDDSPCQQGLAQTFDVTSTADSKVELDETFSVGLSNVVDGGRNVTASAAAGTGTRSGTMGARTGSCSPCRTTR